MRVTTTFNLIRAGLSPWRKGFLIPARFSGTVDDKACPYTVELELELRDGQVECSAARFVRREDGPPVAPRLLRSVPLAAYVKAVTAEAAWPIEQVKPGLVEGRPISPTAATNLMAELGEEARRGGRRPLNEDFLREVAETYRAGGDEPRKAVAGKWQVAASTAARWIKAARDAGLLEERS